MNNLFRKIILLLAVPMAVTLFSSTVEPCPEEDDPNHTVLIADPSDCAAFFVCFNGIPIRHLCPAGLHFDPKLEVCDWPLNEQCEKRGGTAKPHSYSCHYEIHTGVKDGQLIVIQMAVYMEGTACDEEAGSCTPYDPCPNPN